MRNQKILVEIKAIKEKQKGSSTPTIKSEKADVLFKASFLLQIATQEKWVNSQPCGPYYAKLFALQERGEALRYDYLGRFT